MSGHAAAAAAVAGAVSAVAEAEAQDPAPDDLDYERVAGAACSFIRERIKEAGAAGAVFGLSGGIDSSVVAYLSARALGAGRCLALLMPNEQFTPDSETDDGLLVARRLGIRHKVVPIGAISSAAVGAASMAATAGGGEEGGPEGGAGGPPERVAVGNLNARLRAALLYYEAQAGGRLVVGTDDRSEYLIGYFTKYGDGASDLLPIADLYKTQVQRLGRHLGVPGHIVAKAPSPHLWKDHDAAGELGVGYGAVDAVLARSTSGAGTTVDEALAMAGADADAARRVVALNRASAHKRALPPIASLRSLRAAQAGGGG